MPTATERLTAFLREQPPAPVHEREPPSDAEIRARVERARTHSAQYALLATLVDRDTSFELFELRMYPAVLVREPWDEGVMTEHDLCVAKNGAGDLHLWDLELGHVRLVVHDEGWTARHRGNDFDGWLEHELWSVLENMQPDDLDAMDDTWCARVRLAIEIAGADAMNEDTAARARELGLAPG